jgi:hypothetical protein
VTRAAFTGLWATQDRLYVSCPYDNTIKVFDAQSMARLAEWSVERPGVPAMDGNGVLWTRLEPDGTSPQAIIRSWFGFLPPNAQCWRNRSMVGRPSAC